MGEERQGGTIEVEVNSVTAEKVWRFLDFAAIDKVAPDVESSTIVDGIAGEPGCTRYNVLKPIPGLEVGPDGKPFVPYLKEKLLTIDHEKLSFSYEVTETNLGFIGYTSQVKVVENCAGKCRIEWSFKAESFGLLSRDGFAEFLLRNVRGIAKTIERAVEEA